MKNELHRLLQLSDKYKNIYKPTLYKLKFSSDKKEFENLLRNNPNLNVFDEILGQVEELIKSRNPQRVFTKNELSAAAIDFIGNEPLEEYGVWVHYPWSNRLVHILDEKEFVEVRTNRNRNKISIEEREILSKTKIGIIGLSVGQSVALTMAMERIFGELRIADFDILELSNLNRIRTGVNNLGILKVVAVAREIAEIDPFLNVRCYSNGITESTIDDFFTEGAKLDILVEVCDSIDIKIISRIKAKEFGIPVLMDTSDRGMIDVERFDLEPSRPLFHGIIDGDDCSTIKKNLDKERMELVLKIVEFESLSNKMKNSLSEIGKTINTWPQLASSVVLGGAVVTDICRRIILKEFNKSGRYYVDINEIIKD